MDYQDGLFADPAVRVDVGRPVELTARFDANNRFFRNLLAGIMGA